MITRRHIHFKDDLSSEKTYLKNCSFLPLIEAFLVIPRRVENMRPHALISKSGPENMQTAHDLK